MRFSKYAQVLLLSPITGSLVVCCLGIAACGAFLAGSWRPGNGGTNGARRKPAVAVTRALDGAPAHGNEEHAGAVRLVRASTPAERRVSRRTGPVVEPMFHASLSDDEREFLKQLEGTPAQQVVRSSRFRAFVDSAVPYAPFHYHVDVPLTQAIESVLFSSQDPVRVRAGRYLLVSKTSGETANRGFLWIDLQDGTTVGGIYFRPSNGEPTPTLTLFSRQVTSDSIHIQQMPAEFLSDLRQWISAAGVQPVATRYFVNASNRKSVLLHEERFCTAHEDAATREVCEHTAADAAALDAAAIRFLSLAHFASNATQTSLQVSAVPGLTSGVSGNSP